MGGKTLFSVILMGLLSPLISFQLPAQPCPFLKLNPSQANQSYLEIQSPEGNHKIPLPDIMVFPEGKERIYCLLPDILTTQNTPIFQWNELVLKKGLNTSDTWQGSIDRASFYQTSCLPGLEPTNFKNAMSGSDFSYAAQSNIVSLKGIIFFPDIDGNKILLHLNIVDQEIPKPKINNLSGKLFTPSGEMEVISGEIGFEKNKEILRGSGIASSDLGNQGFEFLIPNYAGKPGSYVVNEGNEKNPMFSVFKVTGKPSNGLEVNKYEIQPSAINFSSFFSPFPFSIDSLDLNQLKHKSKLVSSSIAIDPKPNSIKVPLFNTAFVGKQLDAASLQLTNSNAIDPPQSWQESLTIKLRSYPIWQFQVEEIKEESENTKLVVKNTLSLIPDSNDKKPFLNMDQVNAMNSGFSNIFQSFDEDSDTLQLKKSVLLLFSENNLPTSASFSEDFENFLVTTVTEFREQEKLALEKAQSPTGEIAFNGNENQSYELLLDEKAHFPVLRNFEIDDTKIQIQYGDTITIEANNTLQGTQVMTIPGNSELYDIFQFYSVLKQLPFSLGFKTSLGFFDLSVENQTISTETEQINRQLIVPDFIHANIDVEEELVIDNQAIYKVNVMFQGLKNSLFVENYQPENSGIYYISKSKPHQLIKAVFDGGIVLEQ